MATHPRNETTNGGGEAGVSTLNIILREHELHTSYRQKQLRPNLAFSLSPARASSPPAPGLRCGHCGHNVGRSSFVLARSLIVLAIALQSNRFRATSHSRAITSRLVAHQHAPWQRRTGCGLLPLCGRGLLCVESRAAKSSRRAAATLCKRDESAFRDRLHY